MKECVFWIIQDKDIFVLRDNKTSPHCNIRLLITYSVNSIEYYDMKYEKTQ